MTKGEETGAGESGRRVGWETGQVNKVQTGLRRESANRKERKRNKKIRKEKTSGN